MFEEDGDRGTDAFWKSLTTTVNGPWLIFFV